MEKNNKIIRVYSVVVSIITVVTFIICLAGLVSSMIDRQDPLSATYNGELYSSFENFKLEKMKDVSSDQAYIPSDEELLKMYETAKAEKLAQTHHRIKSSLTVNSLILGVAIVLFIIHFRMVRNSKE